jgi:hypothetical protein
VAIVLIASGLALETLHAASASAAPAADPTAPTPTRVAPLVAPTQFPPTTGPGSITVNWKPPESLTPSGLPDHYTIAMLAPGATKSTSVGPIACPTLPCSHTFGGLAAGHFNFVVIANDALGNRSPASQPQSADPQAVATYVWPPPAPPVQWPASNDAYGVTISWFLSYPQVLTPVSAYNVFFINPDGELWRMDDTVCPPSDVLSPVHGCSRHLTRSELESTSMVVGPYTFFVEATGSGGSSAPSNIQVVYFTPTPAPPVQTAPSQGPGTVTVNWLPARISYPAAIIDHFTIFWVNPNREWWAVAPIQCTTLTCTFTFTYLTAPGPYEIYIESDEPNGYRSSPSNPVVVYVAGGDTVAPTPPLAFRSTAQTPDTISATWQASVDNVGVANYWAWYKDPDGVVNAWGPIPCCGFNYPYLTKIGTYTLWATAWDAAGNQSQQSNPSIVYHGPVQGVTPDAPTNVSATGGNAQAAVTWTPPSNLGLPITSYTVTASPGGQTATVSGSQTSATVLNLTNGTAYTFTVYATNPGGNGPQSSSSNAVTPVGPPAVPPTNVTAAAGNAQATVTWTPPSSNGGSAITSYTITSSGGQTATACGTCTSATVVGLTNGVTYTFTAQATNAYGNSPTSSPSNAVTPSGLPDPPSNVTATAGPNDVVVSWTPPSNTGGATIDSYLVQLYVSGAYSSETWVGGTATQYDWSGLTPGAEVYFVVWSHTSVGRSTSGGTSNTAIPGANAPPGVAYGNAGAYVLDNTGSTWETLDGVYANIAIPANMNVPLINIDTGQMRASVSPNLNERVVGHNTRAIQLIAVGDRPGANLGEFVAVGVTAGCMHATGPAPQDNCTGIAPNGGVYKKMYLDGCSFHLSPKGCAEGLDGYFQQDLQAVSAGDIHTVQIQRHYFSGDPPDVRAFGIWIDGSLVARAWELMIEGEVNHIVESASGGGTEHGWPVRHVILDMNEPCFGPFVYGSCVPSTQVHYFGDASTSPPGPDASYHAVPGWFLKSPSHTPANPAGCQVYEPDGHTALAATGYC